MAGRDCTPFRLVKSEQTIPRAQLGASLLSKSTRVDKQGRVTQSCIWIGACKSLPTHGAAFTGVAGWASTDAYWQRHCPGTLGQEIQQQEKYEEAIFKHCWRAAKPTGFRADQGKGRRYGPCWDRRFRRETWPYEPHCTIAEAALPTPRRSFFEQMLINFPSKAASSDCETGKLFPKAATGQCCGDMRQLPILPSLMVSSEKREKVSYLPKGPVRSP